MNLYIRYFNDEVLVNSLDQALDFLANIPEIALDEFLVREVTSYVEGNLPYPKRFKVNQRSYFIIIKTTANDLEEFKNNAASEVEASMPVESEKAALARTLSAENPGWYKATIVFKRVIPAESTGKFQYVDTEFEAKVKAHCIQECYDRIIDHLRTRGDVDPRSQFPSIKGRNFRAEFLGRE